MDRTLILTLILAAAISGCISVEVGSSKEETQIESVEVPVTDVVDGDTVDIRYTGREDTVRLEGIDTPEVHTENDPAEFEGIPNTEDGEQCLADWGENASSYVKNQISDKNVTLRYEVVEGQPERGSYGRIIGEILHKNVSINRELVVQGYARSYSENGPFIAEEAQAQHNRTGLWECRSLS
ncbi:MAG: micrococcal nuclease [Candidatus Nanohaloarchaea archaeon]|jgi:micrococcal nuclease